MDVKKSIERYDQAVSTLSPAMAGLLLAIPAAVKSTAYEVRLRVGKPVALTCRGRCWFVDRKSQLHNLPQQTYLVTPKDIADSVVAMCSYSLHTHQNEMKQGFISLQGGHRAGVCGTAVLSEGAVSAVRDVTSVNLRIARDIHGAAGSLMDQVFSRGLCGALIVGAPSSGKTTVLRDLARQLAGGKNGRFWKVAVVDERGELGAVADGVPQNDLGVSCDILSGYPKGDGILTAVRTLSPDVILCDEIGGEEETTGILSGIHCGVKVVATAHAGNRRELLSRLQIVRLLEQGAFEKVVWLSDADNPGRITRIEEVGELLGQDSGSAAGGAVFFDDRYGQSYEIVGSGGVDRGQHPPAQLSHGPAEVSAVKRSSANWRCGGAVSGAAVSGGLRR